MESNSKKPKGEVKPKGQVKCGHPNCLNPDACTYPKCNK